MAGITLKILSIHKMPGRTGEVATVEVLRGSLFSLTDAVFNDSESPTQWRLEETATAPADSTRFLVGFQRISGDRHLRPDMQLTQIPGMASRRAG